jgi:hypothetical protein
MKKFILKNFFMKKFISMKYFMKNFFITSKLEVVPVPFSTCGNLTTFYELHIS